ncbi:MAG: tRNA lysidine(34) synthetase TilS [Paracoccaceae bacterium]
MVKAGPGLPNEIIEAFQRLLPAGSIGVAVSGGGDSMALLAMMHETRAQKLFAATVNHGLRAEATDEAEMVAAYCTEHSIPHAILPVSGLADDPGNLQANARDARYRALAEWARTRGLDTILLAHTMDDQAETVLMRLARGSGAEGLAGMADTRVFHGVTFARPLLRVRRVMLRDWLRTRGIAWAEDPSNADPSFDRIKARQALETLAPIGLTIEGLADTADRLRRQVEVLHADAARLAATALQTSGRDQAAIDRTALRNAVPDTAMRFLADQLTRIGGNDYRPRFRALESLFVRLTGATPLRTTLAGCLIEAKGNTVTIRPEHAPLTKA